MSWLRIVGVTVCDHAVHWIGGLLRGRDEGGGCTHFTSADIQALAALVAGELRGLDSLLKLAVRTSRP